MDEATPMVPDEVDIPSPSDTSALPPALPDPPKPYPGLWQGLWILARYFLFQVAFIIPFATADYFTKGKSAKHPAIWALVTFAAGVVSIRLSCSRLGVTFRSLAGAFPKLSLLPSIAMTVVGMLVAQMPLLAWMVHRFPTLVSKQDYGFGESIWGGFILIVVVAPLIEESLFRGILLRGFIGRYSIVRGILLSAAIFGLSHASIVKLIPTLSLGLFFGWLYSQLGSIWPGVFAHAFNNSLAFLTIFSGVKSKTGSAVDLPQSAQMIGMELGMCAIGLVLIAGGVSGLRREIAAQQAPLPTAS